MAKIVDDTSIGFGALVSRHDRRLTRSAEPRRTARLAFRSNRAGAWSCGKTPEGLGLTLGAGHGHGLATPGRRQRLTAVYLGSIGLVGPVGTPAVRHGPPVTSALGRSPFMPSLLLVSGYHVANLAEDEPRRTPTALLPMLEHFPSAAPLQSFLRSRQHLRRAHGHWRPTHLDPRH